MIRCWRQRRKLGKRAYESFELFPVEPGGFQQLGIGQTRNGLDVIARQCIDGEMPVAHTAREFVAGEHIFNSVIAVAETSATY